MMFFDKLLNSEGGINMIYETEGRATVEIDGKFYVVYFGFNEVPRYTGKCLFCGARYTGNPTKFLHKISVGFTELRDESGCAISQKLQSHLRAILRPHLQNDNVVCHRARCSNRVINAYRRSTKTIDIEIRKIY